MQDHHVAALGQALAAARLDEATAVGRVLQVVLDVTGGHEARLLLLQSQTLEVWRLTRGGEVSLGVVLDGGDDDFASWRDDVDRRGGVVLTASLPLGPGVDAGLLAVHAQRDEARVHHVMQDLPSLALHAASVAAVGRADLERRIAVAVATDSDVVRDRARRNAEDVRNRARSASSALSLSAADASYREDAEAHLAALAELADTLVNDLSGPH